VLIFSLISDSFIKLQNDDDPGNPPDDRQAIK
jgi:hypothetical protein